MKKLINAYSYSISGIRCLLKERAFVQELFVGIFILLFIYCIDNCRAYVFSSYMLVLIIEAINTSIEKVVDRISTDIHELSKEIKDVSSAAVFLSIINLIVAICSAALG